MKNVLKLGRIENRIAITPNGNCSTASEDALRLSEECRRVEPVKTLRNCYEIDRMIGETARFRSCYAELDFLLCFSTRDLLRAGVSGDDTIKPGGKSTGGLAVSGGAVECYPREPRE
jgi:hypothetical protein